MESADSLARLSGMPLGVYMLIASAESLASRHSFANGGLLGWDVLSLRFNAPAIRQLSGWMFSYPQVLLLPFGRLLLGLVLVCGPITSKSTYTAAIISSALISLLISFRNRYGGDGADQMALIVSISMALGYAAGSDIAIAYSLLFIAFQSQLAYFTSGMAKIVSIRWRNGDALRGILCTKTYGIGWVGQVLTRHRLLAAAMSWAAMSQLLLFAPLCLTGGSCFWMAVCFGACFHVFNAIVMRLHTFVWAFAATYPAIYFLRFHWLE